jgi:hypothetical protein
MAAVAEPDSAPATYVKLPHPLDKTVLHDSVCALITITGCLDCPNVDQFPCIELHTAICVSGGSTAESTLISSPCSSSSTRPLQLSFKGVNEKPVLCALDGLVSESAWSAHDTCCCCCCCCCFAIFPRSSKVATVPQQLYSGELVRQRAAMP